MQLKRAFAILAVAAFMSTACFTSHNISVSELEKLQTGFEAEAVWVAVDGCGDDQAAVVRTQVAQSGGGMATADREPVDGIDPVTGCRMVEVSATNPIEVHTREGTEYRITPFNFTLSNTQLVSPDYDLLVPRDDLEDAEVSTFSTGKTIGIIAALTAAAVGTFLAISLTAGESRGLGGAQ